ncbi:cell wall hydrolase [Brucella intermedia]|uniref:Spore germination cell wall hydrolase CwlJ-like protein n=3 Tax=Brucella TaxID=234 RepID=A0ABR6AQ80_9HYPH|nr:MULTISPECIES: cell wall hydrolase [Brucella]ERI13040.1 hydrolase [Ochrobactrum sp. EGD-AQ16]HCH73212.1 cell wall hydrolase [Ochrobactrum sp.]KAB2695734.1 cell wall hydrolase [Brucella intermedia]KAB2713262.1 cell wall hydrolase [Brucella intermedia]MBA8851618.1 spore germination cell wall hydrolase CwlJ-like protein [Brucella intermedia]
MTRAAKWKLPVLVGLVVAPFVVTGCTTTGTTGKANSEKTAANHVKSVNGVKTYTYTARDKECLERAMFFESNRSSPDGLLAVGTVVMNRLASGRYPDTICGVVGQKNQFAPGVLTRRMDSKALPDVQATADAVLKGQRHPKLKNALFFHTAGLRFPYNNMHYVLVAGGNSFYEKRNRDGSLQNPVPQEPYNLALAYSPQSPSVPQDPSYDVTLPQTGPVPGTEPTVQVALAEASKAQSADQNSGVGPQARSDRLARHRDVAVPQQEQHMQMASYQPQFDTTAPQPTSLGYAPASQKQADAIGALLLSQDRPEAPL